MRKLRAINTVLWYMNGRIPEHWESIRFYQQCVLRHRYRIDGDKILFEKGI